MNEVEQNNFKKNIATVAIYVVNINISALARNESARWCASKFYSWRLNRSGALTMSSPGWPFSTLNYFFGQLFQ